MNQRKRLAFSRLLEAERGQRTLTLLLFGFELRIRTQTRRKRLPTQQGQRKKRQNQNENENENENQQPSHPKPDRINAKISNKERRKKRSIKGGTKIGTREKQQGDKDKPIKASAGKRKSISFSSTLESTTIIPSPPPTATMMIDYNAAEEEEEATITTPPSPIMSPKTTISTLPQSHGRTTATATAA